ncbi:MAG: biotin carboxylase N-terminal domain-containing protein [Tetrasphaera sp.]
MIRKVLIANRGEIARRVMRTCRAMGIDTVAVYSDTDADAPFVREADEAVALGGDKPADSYLGVDLILHAARRTGADAIHPGYGFLSENAGFASACADAGIIFIGPSPRAIELMGSKVQARALMEEAGVPVLPGLTLQDGDDNAGNLAARAGELGWPVLVKASAGGGGRGMRVVTEPSALSEAVESARREAQSAFGDPTVFLEHYVERPRHVEIQIVGDTHGTVVHLGERDCSLQRRHQKVIEESPSPAVTPQLRAAMGAAAVAAGEALGYVGAGTVEFLLGPDGRFFFLEVNTRLQVEHPVTEMVTGLDLVKLQIEAAAGLALPESSRTLTMRGHAIEARLYAEDPAAGFLPTTGTLAAFEIATAETGGAEGVRVDSGFEAGDTVSTSYDPMLAKVIAHAETREAAAALLARALRRARILGLTTNRDLLVAILSGEPFLHGEIDTQYLDRVDVAALVGQQTSADIRAEAIVAALATAAAGRSVAPVLSTIPSGFRNNPSQPQSREFQTVPAGESVWVDYVLGRGHAVTVAGEQVEVQVHAASAHAVDVTISGVRRRYAVARQESAHGPEHALVLVCGPAGTVTLREVPRFPSAEDNADEGSLFAPMPGTVIRLNVAAGEHVTRGQALVVLEAMKMEHTIRAPADGVVAEVPVREGAGVDTGAVLVILHDEDAGEDQRGEEVTDG